MTGQLSAAPHAVAADFRVRGVTLYHDIEQDIDSDADPEDCRRVVQAFLELEQRYAVPVTYNVVGKLIDEQPELVAWIRAAGHEVACHSYNHQPNWCPADYAPEVARCRAAFAEPVGYRSPRSQWDESTVVAAWENGFLWNAEGDRGDQPYFIHRGLVRLPIATDDWPLHTRALTADAWIERFSALLQERQYFGFGAHDSVTSFAMQERLALWERVLQAAVRSGTPLLTFAAAADLFRRSALAQYYSATATRWNASTRRLYRTRRFREIIRTEAEALGHPVVADLGSGGGVLSVPLQDIARAIHCVDNAPGMLADLEAGGCVQPGKGEATGCDLADGCVDLVICARVIEYLFWPDRLADEIRRIGRRGATYVVTFPAARPDTPPGDGRAPDRIRRYFAAQDIERWAARIGRGRLVGVQYDAAEPGDDAAEQRQRELEQSPPPGSQPTNWVYIGRVGH